MSRYRLTQDLEARIRMKYPENFNRYDLLIGNAISRTQVSLIVKYERDASFQMVNRHMDSFYYFYKGDVMLAEYHSNGVEIIVKWHNIEYIPTHGLNNSVRKILMSMRVYSNIHISFTGTYRVLTRMDNKENPRYLYSGATMKINNGDFELMTEPFTPYGRPMAGEKETNW